jgi:hypothetical protein
MKEIDISDLNQWISNKKSDTERLILRTKEKQTKRTRPRDMNEVKILDAICIKHWEKAELEGKIKYISDRVWYYEFD